MTTYQEHPFNNCGVAPFEYIGYAERLYYPSKNLDGTPNTSVSPMAGGCCDHCGTAIRHAYIIRDANGREFDVGSSCIKKASLPAKIVTQAQRDKRQKDKKRKIANEERKVEEMKEDYLQSLEILKSIPHPNEYFASQGKTAKDYYLFCSQNSKTMKRAISQAKKI